jgi:hypothetical protein
MAWLYAKEERHDAKLVARAVANSFRRELKSLSNFDPSPFLTQNVSRQDYVRCIQLEFVMSLGKDLVPQLRPSVAQALGIAKLWNGIHQL